jgi:inosine-uridine nucleoside N-ribohydrolase
MRTDTGLPLYYAAGGGLTKLAATYRAEPRIAERLTAVWVGGPAYPVESGGDVDAGNEYNLAIDIEAACVVFGSHIPLWQTPRDAYRQCLVSIAELDTRVRPSGALGRNLSDAVDRVRDYSAEGSLQGETYCLGDNPLVLVTALQSFYAPDASSSTWQWLAAPTISDDDGYVNGEAGARRIRVMKTVDTRLMFEDLFHKIKPSP